MEVGTGASRWTTQTSHRRDSLDTPAPRWEAPLKLSSQHLQQMFPNFLGKSAVSGWVHGMCQGWSLDTGRGEGQRVRRGSPPCPPRPPPPWPPGAVWGDGTGLHLPVPMVLPSPQVEHLHLVLQVETKCLGQYPAERERDGGHTIREVRPSSVLPLSPSPKWHSRQGPTGGNKLWGKG